MTHVLVNCVYCEAEHTQQHSPKCPRYPAMHNGRRPLSQITATEQRINQELATGDTKSMVIRVRDRQWLAALNKTLNVRDIYSILIDLHREE